MRFFYKDHKTHPFSHQILVAFGGVIRGALTAIIGVILIVNGFFFVQIIYPAFWSMAVGVPLVFGGVSIFIIGVWSFFASIFSFGYSISHCPICKTPVILKDGIWQKGICPKCGKKSIKDKKSSGPFY